MGLQEERLQDPAFRHRESGHSPRRHTECACHIFSSPGVYACGWGMIGYSFLFPKPHLWGGLDFGEFLFSSQINIMSDIQEPIPAAAEAKKETRRRWRFQYSLRTLMVFVFVVSILCSIGACTHWVVPVGLSAIAVSVLLLVTVTARASTTIASIAVVASQMIGVFVNFIHMILSILGGLIGLIHGTDSSPDFDNRLALVGFSCSAVALINCLALFSSPRIFFKAFLPLSVLGNCITLSLATLAITYPTLDVIGGVTSYVIFYSLTFISINAIAVRMTYLMRFNEETREKYKGL